MDVEHKIHRLSRLQEWIYRQRSGTKHSQLLQGMNKRLKPKKNLLKFQERTPIIIIKGNKT